MSLPADQQRGRQTRLARVRVTQPGACGSSEAGGIPTKYLPDLHILPSATTGMKRVARTVSHLLHAPLPPPPQAAGQHLDVVVVII